MKPWEMRKRFGAAASGGPPTAVVTWNASDRSGAVTLSNADLTAEMDPIGGFGNVRATLGRSSGKYCFEVRHEAASPANYSAIGLCTSAHATNAFFADDPYGWAYYEQTGATYNNNVAGAVTGPTYTAGDVVTVAVDFTAGKIWFAKNGAWIGSGSPSAGTAPAYSGLSGTLFPVLSLYSGGGLKTKMTGRFKAAEFSYSPPAGFSPWG